MNLLDVREYVIEPALRRIGLLEIKRVQMVLGTGGVESQYVHLDQTTPGPGPAYGPWQMEKLTHDDLWATYLPYQPSALQSALREIAGVDSGAPHVTTLHWNLMYGAAMCAVHYRRAPGKHPEAGDFDAMARYWKQWYNTPLGKGTVAKALPFFKQAVEL